MAKNPPKTGGKDAGSAPETVTLRAPFGYFDEEDQQHFWLAGTVVSDPEQIADLMARKAPLEGIDHGNTE